MAAKSKMKKICSLVMAVILLLFVPDMGCGVTLQAQAAESINGHQFVTENARYALYMNEEDLSVVVADKVTGAYMESSISYDDGNNNNTWLGAMKSAVVLTMIVQSDDTRQADLLNDNVTKTITYTSNGFTADLYWNSYKLGMRLEVSLEEDGLVARIPDESIREDGDEYQIGTISIYPFMGCSYLDDKEGYLFIPDGNGALIYLDDKEGRFNSGYTAMVYGTDVGFQETVVETLLHDRYNMINDAQKVAAPVYGVAHTDDKIAYLAVIEEGAMRATIEANPNGVNVDYNRIYAKFVERRLYTQPTSNNSSSGSFKKPEDSRSHSDLQIRFMFLSDEEANYCGMANAYRDYLITRGLLRSAEDSYRTRIDFLGTERENWVLGTTAVVMTTVDDIREMYEDLATEGVADIFTVYKGWQKGGLYNVPISKYKADGGIGGTSDLTKLIRDAAADGIQIYLYNDAMRINPDEQNATFNVIKMINKRRFTEDTHKDVYEEMMYLTPARSNKLLNKFAASYFKKGIDTICLAGVSNTLFSYNYSGEFYTRYDCAESYESMVRDLDEDAALVLEQPFAYLWQYTDAFLDMPLYTSNYIFEDESVPFLSIVLKGTIPVYSEYVNFEANKKEFFLKMVETGTYPSFYITKESSAELIYTNSCDIYSSEYSVYRDTIIEYTLELRALNAKVAGAHIVGHEMLPNDVTKVTYDNGVTVYVNYSNTAQTVDGNTVEAMSYKVGE
ncbi:MAG: hypothetical protein HDR21_13175 [Lachnospiraceae bacterium]|nr:hypothetical protein [Lachnospiraceae bacterium]